MATWQRVHGALGYRLDVSTSPSFHSYVNGYQNLDVGNVSGRVVTGLSQGTTYYYRVSTYDATSTSSYSATTTATTSAKLGLIINATFDSSNTSNPNPAAIEAMIQRVASIYESLLSDPITVPILFRYSSNLPEGIRFPSGALSESEFVVYNIPWGTYVKVVSGCCHEL